MVLKSNESFALSSSTSRATAEVAGGAASAAAVNPRVTAHAIAEVFERE
jgi:hypothetical protein